MSHRTSAKRPCPPGRPGVAAALIPLVLLAAACSGPDDEDLGAVPLAEIPAGRRGPIAVHKGYIDDKAVRHAVLGLLVPQNTGWFPGYTTFPGMVTARIYVWADQAGTPDWNNAQVPIIDRLPAQAGYSDFLEVVTVKPTDDAPANAVKSRQTLLLADYELTYTGKIINCPVVDGDAILPLPDGKTITPMRVWYRKRSAHCLPIDGFADRPGPLVTSTKVADGVLKHEVVATVVYNLRTKAFSGADQVSEIEVPDNDIFRYAPGDNKYSPLAKVWDVEVPTDYTLGELTSYKALFPVPDFTDPRIVERKPDTFCNCPIVWVGK